MKLSQKLNEGIKFTNKSLWIILVPVILDILELKSYQRVYSNGYFPHINIFTIKIGFISAPPSVRFLLEDFPSTLFQYNNDGLRGIIYKITPFNIALLITIMLILSYVYSRYMRTISQETDKRMGIRDFFQLENELWWKFFILQLIVITPFILMLIKDEFIYLSLLSIVLVYVKYSCVVDGGSFSDNINKGVAFLLDNFGLTIKMAFFFGAVFSLLSIGVYMLARMGFVGIVIDIIIIAYFGAATNKAVLEIYREVSSRKTCEGEDIIN